ncbi:DUF2474 domain-containing protein [Cobetia amphilecti]|uniref:DUF2474 domain-containing protein n=1 Tax=Cobetia amphilecti TaxID=1055104 RepID=A0AAP4TXK5_9GAMM|nr:DUF2474 domain-containing protein [Cobetia amphilecti]MDO6670781.1 DUF2474 domain-containing protein [Cobetia amphilecti]
MTSPAGEKHSTSPLGHNSRPGHETHDIRHTSGSWLKKIGWLMVIWGGSVAALGIVSLALRSFMQAAGLTP